MAPDSAAGVRRGALVPLALLILLFVVGTAIEASPERATLLGFEGPTCPSRWILPDRGCPGCGLTRATALTLDGDLQAAWGVNPAGLVVVLFALGALLVHASILVRGKKNAWTFRLLRSGRVLFAACVLAAWLLR